MRTTVWLASLAVAFAVSDLAAAGGEANRRQASSSSASSQPRQSQQADQARSRLAQGQLISYRTTRLQGEREPHVLGKVRLDSGRTVVVNLGPVSNLQRQNVQLRPNQQVQATGKPGRINGLPVLMVDRFVADGRATVIAFVPQARQRAQNQQQSRASSPASASQKPSRTLILASGRLTDVRDVDLRGLPESHRQARLRTRAGNDVIVDFGSRRALGDIRLDRGEYVTIIGSLGRVNGTPVIFAHHVADLATIDRTGERPGMQSTSSSSRQQSSGGSSFHRTDPRRD